MTVIHASCVNCGGNNGSARHPQPLVNTNLCNTCRNKKHVEHPLDIFGEEYIRRQVAELKKTSADFKRLANNTDKEIREKEEYLKSKYGN